MAHCLFLFFLSSLSSVCVSHLVSAHAAYVRFAVVLLWYDFCCDIFIFLLLEYILKTFLFFFVIWLAFLNYVVMLSLCFSSFSILCPFVCYVFGRMCVYFVVLCGLCA